VFKGGKVKVDVTIIGADKLDHDLRKMPDKIKKQAWKLLRVASMGLMRAIKKQMPVDTGRARAGWGQWTPGGIRKPNPDATKDDAVWDENEGDMVIVQGTNIGYVFGLNRGNSRQAPAGFIDKATDKAQRELVSEVNAMIDKEFG
jgi:hypothetical protein